MYLIEILTFLVVFAASLKEVTFQNLLIDKICLVKYNYTHTLCNNISEYKDAQEKVQKSVNDYQLYLSIIISIPNIISIALLGPWSDRHGRKLLIVISTIGYLLESIMILLNVIWFDISENYLLLSAIPPGLCGGLVCLVTGTYSYVCDISVEKSRTLRFTILEVLVKFGLPLGMIVGGQIFKYLHYVGIFGSTSALFGISVVIAICLKESLTHESQDRVHNFGKCLKDVFNTQDLRKRIIACFNHHSELKEILLIISMFFGVIAFSGIEKIDFLYAKRLYDWNVSTYSTVNSLFSIGSCILIIIMISIFIKIFNMPDVLLGLFGFCSGIANDILKAFATKPIIYYAACISGMLSGISTVAIRAVLSKLVNSNEVGSIFSLLAICEAGTPLFAGILFLKVYNAMYHLFSGFVYFISAFLKLFGFIVFIWLIVKKSPNEALLAPLLTDDENNPSIQQENDHEIVVS